MYCTHTVVRGLLLLWTVQIREIACSVQTPADEILFSGNLFTVIDEWLPTTAVDAVEDCIDLLPDEEHGARSYFYSFVDEASSLATGIEYIIEHYFVPSIFGDKVTVINLFLTYQYS